MLNPRTDKWSSWANNRSYWLDPNNKPPHWRIRKIMERSKPGLKLLKQIDQVERRKGFGQR